MNLPEILNVALGLVVLFFLLSSIASLVAEFITTAARYREEILYVSINRLLAGEPDQPWDIPKLVLDRIGRRLPDRFPFRRLRRRWVHRYAVATLSADHVQRFWQDTRTAALNDPAKSVTEKMHAFAAAVEAFSHGCDDPDRACAGRHAFIRDLAVQPATTRLQKLGESVNKTRMQNAAAQQTRFLQHPRIKRLGIWVSVPTGPALADLFAEVVLELEPPAPTENNSPGEQLRLLRALSLFTTAPDVVRRFWSAPATVALVNAQEREPAPTFPAKVRAFAAAVLTAAEPRFPRDAAARNRLHLLGALSSPDSGPPPAGTAAELVNKFHIDAHIAPHLATASGESPQPFAWAATLASAVSRVAADHVPQPAFVHPLDLARALASPGVHSDDIVEARKKFGQRTLPSTDETRVYVRARTLASALVEATDCEEFLHESEERWLVLLRALKEMGPNGEPAARASDCEKILLGRFKEQDSIASLAKTPAPLAADKFAKTFLFVACAEVPEAVTVDEIADLLEALAPVDAAASPSAAKGPDIVQRFWHHPKIRSLASSGADSPPAMEAATFAAVLIDIAIPRDAQGVLPDNRLALLRALDAPNETTPVALLRTLRNLGISSDIPVGATGEALWSPFRTNVATWFNEGSARATELYRKTMQRMLLAMGFCLALFLNADALRIIHILSTDGKLAETMAAFSQTLVAERSARQDAIEQKTTGRLPIPDTPAGTGAVNSTAAAATGGATTPPATANQPAAATNAPPATAPAAAATARTASVQQSTTAVSELTKTRLALSADIERLREIEQLGFPIGWNGPDEGFDDVAEFVRFADKAQAWVGPTVAAALAILGMMIFKLAGLGGTALAVSQGAPFWYDLMNRIIGLRKGVTPPPEDSKDKKDAKAANGAAAGNSSVPPSPLPLEIGHDLAAPATSFNARKAYWLARASEAAYSPPREIEALVRGTWKFHEFHFFERDGAQAFCASDEQVVLLAFRGTELKETSDILADVNIKLTEFAGYGTCQVHAGFKSDLDKVWHGLSKKILEWTEPAPRRAVRQIFITGHSLGGALATLAFARLVLDPKRPTPTLYTFGCPKVGDDNFAGYLDRRHPERIFRMVHDQDVVPKLPPLPDYFHAGREFVFEKGKPVRMEISGLSRLLRTAALGARDLKSAGSKAVDDHSMVHYVARCEEHARSIAT